MAYQAPGGQLQTSHRQAMIVLNARLSGEMSMGKPNNSILDSFLTPEAMLTPGAAGALTMMITNSLGVSFSIPRALTALILSFAFGLLVLVADKSMIVKAIFYVLNSLVIFCVASGANGLGTQQRLSFTLVTPAVAQTSSSLPADWQSKYKQLSDEFDDLSRKIEQAKSNSTSKDDLITLIARRDEVDKQRTDILSKFVNSQTGISVDDIKTKGLGGPNSVIRQPFFQQWRF